MRFIELRSPHIQARVSSQGAQLLDARQDGAPLLWLSPLADFTPGKAIRGGVPVCFPWFGKHPQGLPAHGFARNREWTVLAQSPSSVRLALDDDPDTHALWPHRFHAEIDIALDDGITLQFSVENRDEMPFDFTYALHSYFAVADSRQCTVFGLQGRLRREVGHVTMPQLDDAVTLAQSTDAIFEQAPGELVLHDGDRRIVIEAGHMRSAVVWNPGEAAQAMPDIGPHWPAYVCVERGNLGSAAVTLAAGERHVGRMRICRVSEPCVNRRQRLD